MMAEMRDVYEGKYRTCFAKSIRQMALRLLGPGIEYHSQNPCFAVVCPNNPNGHANKPPDRDPLAPPRKRGNTGRKGKHHRMKRVIQKIVIGAGTFTRGIGPTFAILVQI